MRLLSALRGGIAQESCAEPCRVDLSGVTPTTQPGTVGRDKRRSPRLRLATGWKRIPPGWVSVSPDVRISSPDHLPLHRGLSFIAGGLNSAAQTLRVRRRFVFVGGESPRAPEILILRRRV